MVALRCESRSRRHGAIQLDTRTDDAEISGAVVGRVLAGTSRPESPDHPPSAGEQHRGLNGTHRSALAS